jgi:hypothetical protein
MENKNNTPQEPTRRQFAKRAYVAPVVLAAIKATESVADAQSQPQPAAPTIASVR